jgi:hypothetical protein
MFAKHSTVSTTSIRCRLYLTLVQEERMKDTIEIASIWVGTCIMVSYLNPG